LGTHTKTIKSNENQTRQFSLFPEEVANYLNLKCIIIYKTTYSKI